MSVMSVEGRQRLLRLSSDCRQRVQNWSFSPYFRAFLVSFEAKVGESMFWLKHRNSRITANYKVWRCSVAVLQFQNTYQKGQNYTLYLYKYRSFLRAENSLSRTATLQHCNAIAVLESTLKKIFEKSWSFIRKPHFQCRTFAPSIRNDKRSLTFCYNN